MKHSKTSEKARFDGRDKAGQLPSPKKSRLHGPCLNNYPFTPTWSPAVPVPLGRIPVQVRQVIDRIQVSIPAKSAIFDALRQEFSEAGFACKGEYSELNKKTKRMERKCRFEFDGCRVNLVRPEDGKKFPCYRVEIYQPSPAVQQAVRTVLSVLPVPSSGECRRPWSVKEIEVALDVMPVDVNHLDLVRLLLLHGMVLPRTRHKQYFQVEGTDYVASGQHIHKARYGFRVYLKPEGSSPEFVRCELQMNGPKTAQLNLNGLAGLLISPEQINVFDHLQYLYLDERRLTAGLDSRFKRKSGSVRWWRSKIIKGGSMAQSLDEFREFNKRYQGIRKERVFLPSPKQAMLFADLSQGFVRQRYRTRPFPS